MGKDFPLTHAPGRGMLRYGSRVACPSSLKRCSPRYLRSRCASTDSTNKAHIGALVAPKATIDVRSIRTEPALHSQNCRSRRYDRLAEHPQRIVENHARWLELEKSSLKARHELKKRQAEIVGKSGEVKEWLLERARSLRGSLEQSDTEQQRLKDETDKLAWELPNLMSNEAPLGDEPYVIESNPPPERNDDAFRDHVRIGTQLEILDFGSAVSTSGWGFYFLLNEAEKLEHALVQYARSIAQRYGYGLCSPPTMIYSAIGQACGFQPRDKSGEQQVYEISRSFVGAQERKPRMSLAGTGEIPFAAMLVNKTLQQNDLPRRIVGSSRCYRAEAGARGRDTRGLYRVHEFTKVEMFAWTLPGGETKAFDEMVAIQKEIVSSLCLPFRLLEMPAHELGASASRKRDIEVFFPSRKDLNGGWGEVTSTSICTDYQTRRLNTRVKIREGQLEYPSTINGTAMAVPRVLAAILENGWENDDVVKIPEVLWPWMDGQQTIGKHRKF